MIYNRMRLLTILKYSIIFYKRKTKKGELWVKFIMKRLKEI